MLNGATSVWLRDKNCLISVLSIMYLENRKVSELKTVYLIFEGYRFKDLFFLFELAPHASYCSTIKKCKNPI